MNNERKTPLGFDRRMVLQSMLAAAIAPAALSNVRRAEAQDANALLELSAKAMAQVQSFVFTMTTVQGKSMLLGNLELQEVNGVVQRPDKFKADITLGASIVSVTVKVIGIGDRVWITNPMSSDQAFVQASSGGDSSAGTLTSLLNPDHLFLVAVRAIQNPTIDGTEKIDDVETTKIKGVVNLSTLPVVSAFATPGAVNDSIANYLDLSEKTLIVWIDAAGLVHRLRIEGPITKEESKDVVREIDFSNFNEPQDIQPPVAGA